MKESIIFSERNLTEIVHYVYRVIIDGKYYIGKHTGFLNDLITGRYRTSSKLVHEKLKNGTHFSKIKIIGVFSTEKEALEFEERILTRVDAKRNPKFLNQSNGNKDFYNKQHTEKTKEKISKKAKEQFDQNTESGRRNLENHSKIQKNVWDENTEQGRKLRENQSKSKKEYYNPNTEEGQLHLEENRRRGIERFNPETEEGQKRREHASKKSKAQFDPETEEGQKRREDMSEKKKEETKERLQKRQDNSILGELMFDEAFIRENFLIFDDKNNPRFPHSVYSKLTGFSNSFIKVHKREGKLSFLSGIKSKKLNEEQELAKIEEIKAIIKSGNNT